SVCAGVGAPGGVEAADGHVGLERVALLLPGPSLAAECAMVLGDAQGTVEGEPAHELGVDVVGAIAADLPDASIGLAPAAGDLASEAVHRAPCLGVEPVPVVGEEPCCVEYPAVAVELVLPRRPVAEAYRPAAGSSHAGTFPRGSPAAGPKRPHSG